MLGYTDKNYKEYRVGYLYDKSGNKQSFRYHKLSRQDIQLVEPLKNLTTMTNTITIETTSIHNFSNDNKIEINGRKYKILSVYTEEQEQYDGYITSNTISVKYIILGN